MFEKKTKSYTDLLGKTNRIVEGTRIKGNIYSVADFRLDGELTGNFQCEGKIVIGPAGIVVGDIDCKSADIEGRFSGKIQVVELLNIKATAAIYGEVTVGKLSVEPGADFSATCTMKTNPPQANNGE
ncbi:MULTISPECIES: polymer-forming cytoskeletal protein [Flavobacterium]|uniref:Polymer-forming cytoskeletal protein n=1 Tax=Flavobacterium keumense TaxID=1306518 RepID=A0ABY8N6F1_9FLAO|nr:MULTISPECIES: polymer-forming cytoskeletal protein [Flavobacterium]WGK95220.1 polymer-forming cytoskeletal protein [Flavobacterium keumense]